MIRNYFFNHIKIKGFQDIKLIQKLVAQRYNKIFFDIVEYLKLDECKNRRYDTCIKLLFFSLPYRLKIWDANIDSENNSNVTYSALRMMANLGLFRLFIIYLLSSLSYTQ